MAESAVPDGEASIAEIFPDPVLASWVADRLGVQTSYAPTAGELAGIGGRLDLSLNNLFATWAGLDFLIGLTDISFTSCSNLTEDIGTFPTTLTNLQFLHLSYTSIDGAIGDFPATLTNLHTLGLAATDIGGAIGDFPD
jgi:hypothetical protein